MDITIYHNPACGTSRNTLALIRAAGFEPQVIEYLQTPPTRTTLEQLVAAIAGGARALLREKGTPYEALGLGDVSLPEADLIDAMIAHPILMNRPLVISPKGVKLCRPADTVFDLLPPQAGPLATEDDA